MRYGGRWFHARCWFLERGGLTSAWGQAENGDAETSVDAPAPANPLPAEMSQRGRQAQGSITEPTRFDHPESSA
jgi:hypothetical protein